MPADRHSPASLVLVGGTGRSGSTLLGMMLGDAEGAFHVGEVSARYRPWRRHHFVLECSGCGRVCETWRRLADLPERRLHAGIAERLGVRHVIDTSKSLAWIWDSDRRARRRGLEVRHLAIWKEPRDLAYSVWKRGGGIADWERVFVSYYHRYAELGLPFASVPYRRLASEPEKTLRAACGALGLPYDGSMHRFWEHPQHHLFGSGNIVVDRARPIRPTTLPDTFLEIWDRQPSPRPEIERLLDILVERDVTEGLAPRPASPPRRLPPPWYLKARAFEVYKRYRPDTWRPPRYRPEAQAPPTEGERAVTPGAAPPGSSRSRDGDQGEDRARASR